MHNQDKERSTSEKQFSSSKNLNSPQKMPLCLQRSWEWAYPLIRWSTEVPWIRHVQAVAAEKVGDTEQPHRLSPLHTSEAETQGIRHHNKKWGYSMDYSVLHKILWRRIKTKPHHGSLKNLYCGLHSVYPPTASPSEDKQELNETLQAHTSVGQISSTVWSSEELVHTLLVFKNRSTDPQKGLRLLC